MPSFQLSLHRNNRAVGRLDHQGRFEISLRVSAVVISGWTIIATKILVVELGPIEIVANERAVIG